MAQNRIWAARSASEDPDLLPSLAKGQAPEILWIGCADSRVPETTVTGLKPGDVFVHRNIANVLHPGDLSAAAVVEYAVNALRVRDVIVCGHSGCGGVAAALGNKAIGVIDTWLLPLRALRMRFRKELEGLGQEDRVLRLVRENVLQGVRTLMENPNVMKAVKERGLAVHGLVYHVKTGELEELEVAETEEEKMARVECFDTN